jgi:6-phosphogluconolactonase
MKMQKPMIRVFPDVRLLADHFAEFLEKFLADNPDKPVTIALSGGSTPAAIFRHLSEHYNDKIHWNQLQFFWGDERCVPPDHKESNYRMARETLLEPLGIPDENIFRVKGEMQPQEANLHYTQTILENVPQIDGYPRFDLVMLGLGDDGHTASIFPGDEKAIGSGKVCEWVSHPQTGQKRVTLTFPVINNAKKVVFLATGAGKAAMVKEVVGKNESYPASLVNPEKGELKWLMDEAAAGSIV